MQNVSYRRHIIRGRIHLLANEQLRLGYLHAFLYLAQHREAAIFPASNHRAEDFCLLHASFQCAPHGNTASFSTIEYANIPFVVTERSGKSTLKREPFWILHLKAQIRKWVLRI